MEQNIAQLRFRVPELLVESGYLLSDFTHFPNALLRIFLVLLHDADFLGNRVALALKRFRFLQKAAALLFQLREIIQIQWITAVFKHLTNLIEMLADKFDV